jgi:NAD(P)-dependent dehydrogenase (short-subunit alcohol dehydrogenase family)
MTNRASLAVAIFVVVAAIVVNAYLFLELSASDDGKSHPYYPSSWCNPLQPVAVVYMAISHLLLIGRNAPKSLPEPTPENTNKVAIVTGANTGIGYETARTLVVDYGWDVVLACRSTQKAVRAMLDINEEPRRNGGEAIVLMQPLDLSRFGSIQLFVDEFRERFPKVDVLINNAGINTSGKSGRLDLLFQSNFLGHFLLTRQLIEAAALNKEHDSHVINLSSAMHHFSGRRALDENYWKSVALHTDNDRPPETYAASKLAAILFSHELTRRYDLRSTAVNPGSATSDIWRGFPQWIQQVMKVFFLTPRQACRPVVAAAVQRINATYLQPYWQLDYDRPPFPAMEMLGPYVGYAATAPRLPMDGGYEAAQALWKVSEELTTLPNKS